MISSNALPQRRTAPQRASRRGQGHSLFQTTTVVLINHCYKDKPATVILRVLVMTKRAIIVRTLNGPCHNGCVLSVAVVPSFRRWRVVGVLFSVFFFFCLVGASCWLCTGYFSMWYCCCFFRLFLFFLHSFLVSPSQGSGFCSLCVVCCLSPLLLFLKLRCCFGVFSNHHFGGDGFCCRSYSTTLSSYSQFEGSLGPSIFVKLMRVIGNGSMTSP